MSRKIEKEIQKEEQEIQRRKVEKNFQDYCISHGKRPMTRRELLGAGVLSFSATMTLPTLAGMLLPLQARAQSDECPSSASGLSLAPFITLNLSGGAMLASNYVPMDAGGQTLASYNKMGLGNGAVPIDREFGNVPFAGEGISKLLVQLRANATAQTLAKTSFVAIPVRSRDDSGDNLFDASGMVAKAGLVGTDLPNLGSNSTETGIRQMYAKIKPPTPLRVSNYTDIAGALALGATGPLSNLEEPQKISLLRLITRLSESQIQKVNNQSGGRMLANLVGCATNKNVELAEREKPTVDVRQDTSLAPVWGVANNTGDNNQAVVFGSMVKSALIGVSGTVALEQGGYDYHNGTRTTGDQRDGEAGATIGRILESAALLGKKVFIYVTSDGSCVSPTSDDRAAPWSSDRGEAGVAFMLAYDPQARPATSGFQIGHFTSGQAADDKFITGGSPELASCAVLANYLKFNNRMDLITPVIGSTFNTSQLDQIIKFT